ncbi:T9SS type B sorting domain-containing protein [Pseudofulvibacter geojedonensis]|uniref:Choice-of-anchor L domain-containing protein n=1 Tax=Pseudofulvibacter geojedonensis TaxID=1123758 RepID=A0ABW3I535_9FLAO
MPQKIFYFFLLLSCLGYSQTVSVDDSTYNATDLANLLLNGSCIDPENAAYSSAQSVAYFNNNNGTFPLSEGIIIRSGIAAHTAGMYTDTNLSSSINNVNDPDLDAIADAVSGQNGTITDTAFLQFDFTPISSDFNFNFIFASNEYGQWQCGFSDVFAFLITDLNTNTTTNLAVIPGTTTPVTVTTVRDNAHNNGCTSENANLFDTYNVNNPAASTINMRGYTTTMSASSSLIPGNPYRIRLAIGDFNNQDFDSAVFIDSGSFTTSIDLGNDQQLCDGDQLIITTGLDENEYTHVWTENGNPSTETSNTLTITSAGTYAVSATKNNTNCIIQDEIIITDLSYNTPSDLFNCDTGASSYSFNLTQNDLTSLGLDPAIYEIEYYNNSTNTYPGNPIPVNQVTNYSNNGNPEEIIIKIKNINNNNYCNANLTFDLLLSDAPDANDNPDDIELCDGVTGLIDLTTQNNQILNGLAPAGHNVIYFTSQTDAQNNQNTIGNSIDSTSINGSITIWVRVENANNTSCFDITSFDIIINPLPSVTEQPDVVVCSQYTLPDNLQANESYYNASGGPNGGGQQLNPNDIIDVGGTYYVYIIDDNGCENESDFLVHIIEDYTIPINYCDQMVIPPPLEGVDSNFYTEASQGGTLIPEGTVISINQNGDLEYQGLGITVSGNTDTIYYYAEINGVFCVEIPFPISIFASPPVDEPEDVTTCLSYTLPALTNGTYSGYNAGDNITSSQTITITNTEDNNTTNLAGDPIIHTCTSTSSFVVTIINNPPNLTECGSYTLPDLEVGEYYFEANGQGIVIPQGTTINLNENGDLVFEGINITITGNTDDIYVFAPDTENTVNCTTNMFFTLTINPIPPVDTSDNIVRCTTDSYTLPTLTNGNYYTEASGQGTLIPQGTIISLNNTSGDLEYSNGLGTLNPGTGNINTIHIYNQVNGCDSPPSSFTVEIRPLPAIDNLADVYQCDPYTLVSLTNGNYYTEPNGQGDIVQAGEVITEITTLYIFNEWNDLAGCTNETTLTINVLGVNVGTIEDVNECDSYTLPPLSIGSYYSQQQTFPPNPADEIATGTTFTINSPAPNPVYVYAYNEDRVVCESQTSFTITLTETPNLPSFSNETVCGSYTLPSLDNSSYNASYFSQANGTSPITNNTIINSSNEIETHTIYVYATAFGNTNCSDEESFTVTIHPLQDLEVQGGIICVDPVTGIAAPGDELILSSNLSPAEYTVNWYLNGNLVHTGANYSANEAGTYTVEPIRITPDSPPDCGYNTTTVDVDHSSVAIVNPETDVIISDYFEDNSMVTINISGGFGEYIYQLDNEQPQISNVFTNIPSGDHTIYVIDTKNGCGTTPVDITVVNYPKFFSPNNDGANDYWNIWDLSSQPDAEIFIFDRFGKFLKQIKPSGPGWDGTYNGAPHFSDDYWFLVKYLNRQGEEREFRAHFSLKR